MIQHLKFDECLLAEPQGDEKFSDSISSYMKFLKKQDKVVSVICKCGNDSFQQMLYYLPRLVYRCCNCRDKIEINKKELFMEEKL